MGKILGLNGKPINPEPEAMQVAPKVKPAWEKPTKRETELLDQGMDKLKELRDQCLKIVFNEELSLEERQAKADEKSKDWLKYAGGMNHELIRLNKAHVGFAEGRKPRLFLPNALDIAVKHALENGDEQ